MFFRDTCDVRQTLNTEHVSDADLHFIPGHRVFLEMERCVAESAVFVTVISIPHHFHYILVILKHQVITEE